jgi:hypothetical protein
VPDAPRSFCRELSVLAQEPIAGSAVESLSFVVALEHAAPWGSKAIEQSALPPQVKETLLELPARLPGARPQLIKRDVAAGDQTTLMMAAVGPGHARAVRWSLDDVGQVAQIDLLGAAAALSNGDAVEGSEPVTTPQLLVCTNGKRDQCCAKWGMPLYRMLAGVHTDTWETTHLGGHRFAATLLWLPEGICLGRVELTEAVPLVEAMRRGELHRIDRLRGRVAFSSAEQYAEARWRTERSELRVNAIATARSEPQPDDHVRVTLVDDTGVEHQLQVRREPTGTSARPSCDKDPAAVMGWVVG